MKDTTLDNIALELVKVMCDSQKDKSMNANEITETYEKFLKKVYNLNYKGRTGEFEQGDGA